MSESDMHLLNPAPFGRILPAMITPMKPNGDVDFEAAQKLAKQLVADGADGLVVNGTTGESPVTHMDEKVDLVRAVKEVVDVPVISGAGSNDTAHTARMVEQTQEAGADAVLVVMPYYSRPSQAGVVGHYKAVDENTDKPIIVYDVPSRTGLNIAPETARELSKHPLINGIKEASGNIGQVAKIAALCGDELNIYSGNDDQIVPLLALGGKGVISVLSNVAPQYTHDICAKWFAGETAESLSMQLKAVPLIKALFADVNPIPVKWAMNRLGWNAGDCRLPLVAPSAAVQAQLETAMQEFGLLK